MEVGKQRESSSAETHKEIKTQFECQVSTKAKRTSTKVEKQQSA